MSDIGLGVCWPVCQVGVEFHYQNIWAAVFIYCTVHVYSSCTNKIITLQLQLAFHHNNLVLEAGDVIDNTNDEGDDDD